MNKRQFLKIGALATAGIIAAPSVLASLDPTPLDRINVRRLMVLLKKEMETASKRYLFQPIGKTGCECLENDLLLRLSDYKVRGAIVDYGAHVHNVNGKVLSATIGFTPAKSSNMIAIEMVVLPSGGTAFGAAIQTNA